MEYVIDIDIHEEQNDAHAIIPRLRRERCNPLQWPDDIFKNRFRLDKEQVRMLTNLIANQLVSPVRRNESAPELQVISSITLFCQWYFS